MIEESSHEQGEFISPIFLVPKGEGSFRLILNLIKLNKHMPKIHLKMDTIDSVLKLVHRHCFMTKMYIKDAYSISINAKDRKFLKFHFRNKLYAFKALPNGLRSGLCKFTKLLKPALSILRERNINVVAYIDDLLLLDSSKRKNVLMLRLVFPYLTPWDLLSTRTNDTKKQRTKSLCQNTLSAEELIVRQTAQVLGTLTSCMPGAKFGPLQYRGLEACKKKALKTGKGNFDFPKSLDKAAVQEIEWWINNADRSYHNISQGNPNITLTTDASNTGWGAVTSNSQPQATGLLKRNLSI